MGGTGTQNKESFENSSGRLVEGGGQEGQVYKVDTELNCDPRSAVMESEFKGDDQLNSKVSCSGEGSSNREKKRYVTLSQCPQLFTLHQRTLYV